MTSIVHLVTWHLLFIWSHDIYCSSGHMTSIVPPLFSPEGFLPLLPQLRQSEQSSVDSSGMDFTFRAPSFRITKKLLEAVSRNLVSCSVSITPMQRTEDVEELHGNESQASAGATRHHACSRREVTPPGAGVDGHQRWTGCGLFLLTSVMEKLSDSDAHRALISGCCKHSPGWDPPHREPFH